jgi:hypothetical protein
MTKIICQCEQLGCPHHSYEKAASCARKATSTVQTPHGRYEMCTACATKMRRYLRATEIVNHAIAHCRFGSNSDNTIRIPEPADSEAANLIWAVWRK